MANWWVTLADVVAKALAERWVARENSQAETMRSAAEPTTTPADEGVEHPSRDSRPQE